MSASATPNAAQAQTISIDVDSIIERLLEVRGSRPGKNVQLTENEIKGLCYKARDVFLSQPNLLELEAPIKICGDMYAYPQRLTLHSHSSATVSTMIYCVYSSMAAFLRRPTIFSLEITLIVASSRWRLSAFCWHTR
jgi:hypothetical protein